jgi:hypothetical protein
MGADPTRFKAFLYRFLLTKTIQRFLTPSQMYTRRLGPKAVLFKVSMQCARNTFSLFALIRLRYDTCPSFIVLLVYSFGCPFSLHVW